MIRRTLACALIVTAPFTSLADTAMSSSIGNALDSAEPRSLESIDSELEEIILRIEEARGLVDRSQFDLQDLLERLDFDVERIERFVKEQIAFEQYPGLLRGAQGTLMGRAGNALDQAVLLASLIKDAGFEAEIVRSELSRTQARVLLDQMSNQAPAKLPPGDLEAISSLLSGDASSISSVAAESSPPTTVEQDTQQVARFLLDTIESHEKRLGPPDREMFMIEEARDYFGSAIATAPREIGLRLTPHLATRILIFLDSGCGYVPCFDSERIAASLSPRSVPGTEVRRSAEGTFTDSGMGTAGLQHARLQLRDFELSEWTRRGHRFGRAGTRSSRQSEVFVPVLNGAGRSPVPRDSTSMAHSTICSPTGRTHSAPLRSFGSWDGAWIGPPALWEPSVIPRAASALCALSLRNGSNTV